MNTNPQTSQRLRHFGLFGFKRWFYSGSGRRPSRRQYRGRGTLGRGGGGGDGQDRMNVLSLALEEGRRPAPLWPRTSQTNREPAPFGGRLFQATSKDTRPGKGQGDERNSRGPALLPAHILGANAGRGRFFPLEGPSNAPPRSADTSPKPAALQPLKP